MSKNHLNPLTYIPCMYLWSFRVFAFLKLLVSWHNWFKAFWKDLFVKYILVKSRKCKPFALRIFLTSHAYIYINQYLLRSLIKNTILSLINGLQTIINSNLSKSVMSSLQYVKCIKLKTVWSRVFVLVWQRIERHYLAKK